MSSPFVGEIIVRVPASTSNLGAGFDCIGVAVDRWLTVSACVDASAGAPFIIDRGGTLSALRIPAQEDRLCAGIAALCARVKRPVPDGLHLRAASSIPVARGLGSSAAAVVAGAAIANAILGALLTDTDLIDVSTSVEGHPDNVTPAILGGAALAVQRSDASHPSWVVSPLDVHPDLALIFAVPAFGVETHAARAVLPASLPYATTLQATARAAALVRGLATASGDLLALALDDVLHVPYRTQLVPGYGNVVAAAIGAGAFGATLSGSGSSVVAVAPRPMAETVGTAMRLAWERMRIAADLLVNPPRVEGYALSTDT